MAATDWILSAVVSITAITATERKKGLDLIGGISFFDTMTEKWTKLPPVPANSTFTGMAIEYFAALDGLVILGKQAWLFSNERQKWEELGPSPVNGYHSLFRHNPFRQEVLMAGGNASPQVVACLKKDGKIERLKGDHLSSRQGDRAQRRAKRGCSRIAKGHSGERSATAETGAA